MPRCIICDSCSEIDGSDPQSYRWNERENGYECRSCRSWVLDTRQSTPFDNYRETMKKLSGEVPILDEQETDLEGFEVLVKPRMGEREEEPE